jgi:hypothetical protein
MKLPACIDRDNLNVVKRDTLVASAIVVFVTDSRKAAQSIRKAPRKFCTCAQTCIKGIIIRPGTSHFPENFFTRRKVDHSETRL